MRFAVAKYDSFEGELTIKKVTADSAVDAILREMGVTAEDMREQLGVDVLTVDALIDSSYNGDIPVEVMRIDD